MDDGADAPTSSLPAPARWGLSQSRSSNRLIVPSASLAPFLSSIVVANPLVSKAQDSPSPKASSEYSVCGEGG